MPQITSPTPVNLYSRYMVERFDEKDYVAVPTTFLSFFGQGAGKTVYQPDKLDIDIDIIRANERLAKTVPRGLEGSNLSRKMAKKERFTERNSIFPLIEEESPISANQLLMRRPGESPYEATTRVQRMRGLAKDYHLEDKRRIIRTMNYLASQSIITGQMPSIIGSSVADTLLDFKRKSTHTFTAAASWATASTDILGDLDTAGGLIRQDAYLQADVALCGDTAISGILANTAILAKADNRRVQQVSLVTDTDVPREYAWLKEAGWNFRGILKTPKGYSLHLFSSTEGYDNDAGTFTKYLDDDKCVVLSTQARCDRYFGPPERMPMTAGEAAYYQELFGYSPMATPMPDRVKNKSAVISPDMFFCDAYLPVGAKSLTLRVQAAPIFAPIMTDAYVTIDVTP